MPGKSRHGKRNHPILSKRRKESQRSSAITTLQPVVARTSVPAPATDKVGSEVSIPATSTTPPTGQYAYVIAELKVISVLTGLILVILIVLALVLH